MSRARNIKPGFYKNEDLAECSVWARYIYPGLWTLADREGRLEDRPKRIKGELLPFDSVDVEPLLQELADRKFILRYVVADVRYIQVLAFAKHQSPHYSEKASVIPAPNFSESPSPMSKETPGALPEDSEKIGVMKRGSQPPDSLIPDSLIPDSRKKNKRASGDALCVRFEEFWSVYPRSDGKKPAQDIWGRRNLDSAADRIIADVKRRVADGSWREVRYIPHASTYLNQERWNDGKPAKDLLSNVPDAPGATDLDYLNTVAH